MGNKFIVLTTIDHSAYLKEKQKKSSFEELRKASALYLVKLVNINLKRLATTPIFILHQNLFHCEKEQAQDVHVAHVLT